jgi:transposase
MDEQSNRKRPVYSDEFKRDAVRLVVKEGYSFKAACDAVGVCQQSLRAWHAKLAPPPEPCGDDATVEELQVELKRLRKQLKRTEMEREILKKVAPSKAWERGMIMT